MQLKKNYYAYCILQYVCTRIYVFYCTLNLHLYDVHSLITAAVMSGQTSESGGQTNRARSKYYTSHCLEWYKLVLLTVRTYMSTPDSGLT